MTTEHLPDVLHGVDVSGVSDIARNVSTLDPTIRLLILSEFSQHVRYSD